MIQDSENSMNTTELTNTNIFEIYEGVQENIVILNVINFCVQTKECCNIKFCCPIITPFES